MYLYIYLGGLPAQTRHVTTDLPLQQDSFSGCKASSDAADVPSAMVVVVAAVWGCSGECVWVGGPEEWLDRSLLILRLQP